MLVSLCKVKLHPIVKSVATSNRRFFRDYPALLLSLCCKVGMMCSELHTKVLSFNNTFHPLTLPLWKDLWNAEL